MLFRRLSMLFALFLAISACGGGPGGASDPGSSGPDPTSAAGAAALSSGPIDPETCQGVLGPPPVTHSVELQALTDSGQGGSESIDAMCAAIYRTPNPGDPFLTVALIKFDADGPAAAHFDLLKEVFAADGVPLSQGDAPAEGRLDWVSALMDRDGIGRTTVLHQRNWVMTISVGPTTTDSPWTTADIQAIGESIIGRAQQ